MSATCFLSSDRDVRFAVLLDAVRHDAVAGTRDYRRREIHRGGALCGRHLCDDCEQDMLTAVFELLRRYENAKAGGKVTGLTSLIDAVLARAGGADVEVPTALLRTQIANAGKDMRRKFSTKMGRAAKPEAPLRSSKKFQPLRDLPELFETVVLIVRFANSNTALTPTVMPYGKLAGELNEALRARGRKGLAVTEADMPVLVHRSLNLAEAIDEGWYEANIMGPLSERLTELTLPAHDDQDSPPNWDEMVSFWMSQQG